MSTQPTTPAVAKKARAAARTPQQKAQDLLDQAKARHDRAKGAAKRLDAELQDVNKRSQEANAEVAAAAAAVKYAEQHPDLQPTAIVQTSETLPRKGDTA